MARPLALTDELIDKICEYVENGMSNRDSYLLAGINPGTGNNWREAGMQDQREGKDEDTSIYIRLVLSMDAARSRYYQGLVDCVNAAGRQPQHWQAAMTLLERTNPEVYSKFARLKKYEDLGLDPNNDTPLELVAGVLKNVIKGTISGQEGKQMSEIIANVIKVDENTRGWEIINQIKKELKGSKVR